MRLINANEAENRIVAKYKDQQDGCNDWVNGYNEGLSDAQDIILELFDHSAQPKTGKWISEGEGYDVGGIVYDTWYCSECDHCEEGEEFAPPNFCPNCGADMRGETDK